MFKYLNIFRYFKYLNIFRYLKYTKTSAKHLVQYAEKYFTDTEKNSTILVAIEDLYIKAKSYALMNKSAFFIMSILSLAIYAIPIFIFFAELLGLQINSIMKYIAVVQASLHKAIISLNHIYKQYKLKQTSTEHSMRSLIYQNEMRHNLQLKNTVDTIYQIDRGLLPSQTDSIFQEHNINQTANSKSLDR